MGWELVGRQGPVPSAVGASPRDHSSHRGTLCPDKACPVPSPPHLQSGGAGTRSAALGVMLLGRALQVSLKAQNSEQEGGALSSTGVGGMQLVLCPFLAEESSGATARQRKARRMHSVLEGHLVPLDALG